MTAVYTLSVSPILKAFSVIGSERSAVDSIMKLTGEPRDVARSLVVLIRAGEVAP